MNPSTALATVLLRALADLRVQHVVVCPGSRSAPLAYAAVEAERAGRLRVHVRLDERSAGFLALGLAKEDAECGGSPAVVVTTSGTAVANLHPAVLEASHAGVPMLVLSADRPHELRGTGANQTTDQVKIFGDAVRLFAEIPAPGTVEEDRLEGQAARWRNLASRAVAAARGDLSLDPGPVHLNVAFGDPLVPDGDTGDWSPSASRPAGLTRMGGQLMGLPMSIRKDRRTVVLAGDGATWDDARWLAEAGGWPLLAEPTSGARSGPNAIGPYRLLLDHPRLGARIERVVVFGRPTLSRPVSALLARDGVEVVVVSSRPRWPDAAGRAARVAPAVVPAWLRDAEKGWYVADVDEWLSAWRQAGDAARVAIGRVLDEVDDEHGTGPRLTGPLVAREVAAATGPCQALFAGSSNPIRDLDLAARPYEGDPSQVDGGRGALPDDRAVLANRGLAGIDGTVSTASGVALARVSGDEGAESGWCDGSLVRCLVGDLTFLHDAGALGIGPGEWRPYLQVVVVDDGGGGIFGLLEHGERALRGEAEAATFERIFGTPQAVDVAALCTAYGVAYRRADSLEELRKALGEAPRGTSVVHVRVERSAHRDLAARLREAALAAVDDLPTSS